MSPTLKARISKKTPNVISFEIEKDDFESFCNAVGLFRQEFVDILNKSEKDYKAGRVKERRSLYELIKK